MNVPLTKEFEDYVSRKVESGLYPSASDVVRDGLRLMRERDELHQVRLTDLRKEIDVGIDQADRGLTRPLTAETADCIKAAGRARLGDGDGARSGMNGARFTEQAEMDLQDVWGYTAAKSLEAADRLIDAVPEGVR